MRRLLLSALVAVTFTAPHALSAQAGSTTDIVTGRVVAPDSSPVADARVELTSTSTGAVRRTTTRADGRFTILFRDGGGSFRLSVMKIGMSPARTQIQRAGDDDRIDVTIRLSPNAQQLAAVEVKGRASQSGQQQPQQPAGGSFERNLSSTMLERLPTAPGDLMVAAGTTPGVVPTPGSDSAASSFVIAGQAPSQNNVTVDGASFLFGTLPQDGVRGARVVTNAYDVSQGQFTGGQIAATTKSGSSLFEGSMTYLRRDPRLGTGGGALATFAQPSSQHLMSGGAGGPLLGDRSYWFASAQVEQRNDPLVSLLSATDGVLSELGAQRDSVRRLLDILGPAASGTRGGRRELRNTSGLVRVDWDVADQSSLMVRGDWRTTSQSGSRVSPLGLPSTGGLAEGYGFGGLVSLTTLFGGGAFVNEARLSMSRDRQSAASTLDAPSGVVFVSSATTQGAILTPFSIGGSASFPSASRRDLVEAANELSWLSPGSTHRVKLGVLVNADDARADQTTNRRGTYLYNSLNDLAVGTPSLFVRSFGGTARSGSARTVGLYLGDVWRYSPSLQLVYGVRGEASVVRAGSVANPDVAARFALHPGESVSDVRVSPRFGFTYLLNNITGLPGGALRGGIGEFRGRVPTTLLAAASSANGHADAATQLTCTGTAAPPIDWSALGEAPALSDLGCASVDGSATSAAPSVIGLDNTHAPRVWRASFGAQRRFALRYVVATDATYALGLDNLSASDRNLVGQPFFASGGDSRFVFAPAATIDPRTGSLSLVSSRRDPTYASVLGVSSSLRSRTFQVTSQILGPGFRSGFMNLAYTWQRSRDEANGFGLGSAFLPSTAGDPRAIEWGTSDLERRHNLQLVSLTPLPHALELSVVGRLLSGTRYTPLVSGDVNGDGLRNDRAFVPTIDAENALSDAMSRLMSSTDRITRDCLGRQMGRIAGRNSCATPWSSTIDVQLNARPGTLGLDRRLTLSLIATNVTAGLDRALHGDNVHGWGQPTFPDRTLLHVDGFDPTTRRFRYIVNERFGTTTGRANPFRTPFQLALQAKLALGTDAQRAAIKAQLEGEGGKPLDVKELKTRLLAGIPNPLRELLRVADSLALGLTPEQRPQLQTMQATFETKIDSLVGTAAALIAGAGRNPDPGSLSPKLAPNQQELIRTIERVVIQAKAVLTPEQWDRLPESVRFPLQAPPPKRG